MTREIDTQDGGFAFLNVAIGLVVVGFVVPTEVWTNTQLLLSACGPLGGLLYLCGRINDLTPRSLARLPRLEALGLVVVLVLDVGRALRLWINYPDPKASVWSLAAGLTSMVALSCALWPSMRRRSAQGQQDDPRVT
jgi:hypothetical protein